MQIEYSKKAAKYINALDRPTKQRIKKAIEGLTEQPPKGDIKLLQGFTDGRKRLRVGKYRIIYNYLPNPDKPEKFILYIPPLCYSKEKRGFPLCYLRINTLIKFTVSLPVMTA